MCGIVGVCYSDPERRVDPSLINTMCEAIRHRGPDGDGVLIDANVGIGMRRLSIIDIEGGDQPIFNEDRSIAIVFNGEIYNYRELRRQLVSRGHRFRSEADTETIIHLYEEQGLACVDALQGMFAFAIWDGRHRRLLLARDRFGIKPLYVASSTRGIAFASELKALVQGGLTSRELDWSALDAFFQLGYIPAPATPFADVRKLEPGHLLLWAAGRDVVTRQYWDLPPVGTVTPAHVEETVLQLLDESVADHLVSDVPVAAFLSGGLDSSAVVSSMAVQTAQPPHAFTARFHGTGARDTDETMLAAALAARYGIRHTVVDVYPNMRDLLPPIVRALDEPNADESAIPNWLISEAVAKEYKVVLSGTGGDELFAGYRRHLALLVGQAYGRLPKVVREAANLVMNRIPEPARGSLTTYRLKRFLATDADNAPGRFLGYSTKLGNRLRCELYCGDIRHIVTGTYAEDRFNALHSRGGDRRGLSAGLYLDYKTYLPDDVLALSDRIGMAHSLEIRVPFVDHKLVDRVFGMPDRVKIGALQSKRLLRRALRHRLPRGHFRAPKRGFVGPTASWLRNELKEPLLDELSPDRLRRLGCFELTTANKLVSEHLERRQNREGILWEMLVFSLWHAAYMESPPIAPS